MNPFELCDRVVVFVNAKVVFDPGGLGVEDDECRDPGGGSTSVAAGGIPRPNDRVA